MKLSRPFWKDVQAKAQPRDVFGIKVPKQGRMIKQPGGFKTFTAYYNRYHDPEMNYMTWLSEDNVILRERLQRAVAARPRDYLWISVNMTVKNGGMACPRKWSTRRVRQALTAALKEKGMDKDGKRMQEAQEGHNGLRGSMRLALNERAVIEPFATIQRDTRNLVDALLEKQPSHERRG